MDLTDYGKEIEAIADLCLNDSFPTLQFGLSRVSLSCLSYYVNLDFSLWLLQLDQGKAHSKLYVSDRAASSCRDNWLISKRVVSVVWTDTTIPWIPCEVSLLDCIAIKATKPTLGSCFMEGP